MIGLNRPALATRFGDQAGGGVDRAIPITRCPACDVDDASLLTQRTRNAFADASTGAGDEGNPVF